MRVLHWYPNLQTGGAVANTVAALANAEADLGIEVAIASAKSGDQALYGPVSVSERVRLLTWQPSWTLKKMTWAFHGISGRTITEFRELNPTVIHVHAEFNIDNLQVPRIFDCPILLSPHGAFDPIGLQKGLRWAKRFYLTLADRILYKKISLFHALSPSEQKNILALVPDSYIYCVPNGTLFDESRRPNGSEIGNSKKYETLNLVFVGRLDTYTKGLDILIQAFAGASKELGDRAIRLTLVGPDWNGSVLKLSRLAADLGVTDKVTFTGAIPQTSVADVIERADIYIQLSRHDAFPAGVAQALVAGIPTIASSHVGTTSYAEVAALPYLRVVSNDVEDAKNAIVDFAGRIHVLRELADRHHSAAVEFFSWRRIARMHIREYQSLGKTAL